MPDTSTIDGLLDQIAENAGTETAKSQVKAAKERIAGKDAVKTAFYNKLHGSYLDHVTVNKGWDTLAQSLDGTLNTISGA